VVNVGNQFGCITKDSVAITVVRPFTLKSVTDTFVCAGSSVQLKGSGADMYKWINNTSGLSNTSIANPLATPLANAQYTLVGYDKYGCFTDTARVNIAVQPLPTVNAGADVEILANTPYQLQATGSSDIKQWNWSPPEYLSCANCAAPITIPKAQMNYVVTVKNQYGCAAMDTVRITLQCSQDYVFIPNTFTPNRDGKNDMFYVKGRGVGFIKSMRIYSRWGDLVFEKTNFAIDDRAAGWNGFYKGQLVPIGSYVYFVELACDGGEPFSRKGTITVVY
jgi:gliding motility-associated-like protein